MSDWILKASVLPKKQPDAILKLEREKRRLVVCLLWALWLNRIKANVGEGSAPIADITRRAVIFASEAYQLDEEATNAVSQGRRVKEKWTPPPPDILKTNTDGAFRAAEMDGARGFCIRDSDGNGVLAGSGRLNAVHDALSAEGEASRGTESCDGLGVYLGQRWQRARARWVLLRWQRARARWVLLAHIRAHQDKIRLLRNPYLLPGTDYVLNPYPHGWRVPVSCPCPTIC
jgi:hypothetical protein